MEINQRHHFEEENSTERENTSKMAAKDQQLSEGNETNLYPKRLFLLCSINRGDLRLIGTVILN